MEKVLYGILHVIPDTESIEKIDEIHDACLAGEYGKLESMGYKLCQTGDFGKIWMGPSFEKNFHFLHWVCTCHKEDTGTHIKLAEKSGLSIKRIHKLHKDYDFRIGDGADFPTEDELHKLAECYQTPKDCLKGKSQSQEDWDRIHAN